MNGDGESLKKEIQSLSGKHRKQDIKKLSWAFWLNAEKIINDVTSCLQTQDPEHIKKELLNYAESYKNYYHTLHDVKFLAAQEIFSILSQYIDIIGAQTQNKLTHLLLQYPGVETRSKTVRDILFPQEKTEKTTEEKEISFFDKIQTILHADISDKEKIEQIEKDFLLRFKLQRLSWKTFYRELWMPAKYIPLYKKVDLDIVGLLIKIRKATDEKTISALHVDLEQAIQWQQQQKTTSDIEGKKQSSNWVTVVGKKDVDPAGEKRRKAALDKTPVFHTEELQTKEDESRQEETHNPLDLVGQTMSIPQFLAAFSLDYSEIPDYIRSGDPVPARYFGETKTKKWFLHFFTIGSEKKWHHDIQINVSIVSNGTFVEWQIYKIVLNKILPNSKASIDERKQSKHIQWMLMAETSKHNKATGQKLWDHPVLQKIHRQLQSA